jgi:hypothetical protein
MERLFSPCNRLHDMIENRSRPITPGRRLQELNLNVSTEALFSAERAFTYAKLYAVLGINEDTVVWLTPHAAVAREGSRGALSWAALRNDMMRFFQFDADGRGIAVFALSLEHLLDICDVLLRLLAASVVHSVVLDQGSRSDGACINAPSLAHLLEYCKSLKVLRLRNLKVDKNNCRVLGSYSRPDLEIELEGCVVGLGVWALVEVLKHNQGPTRLWQCKINELILDDGLRGNSRLKSFSRDYSEDVDIGNRQLRGTADVLRENKGLVELSLHYHKNMSDETWDAICDSLKTHPTLEVLNLFAIGGTTPMAPDVITSRIQALVDMMKENTSIHKLHIDNCYSNHELFRGSVIPYLETNRLRPRLLAIQKTRPTSYRAKVLGRALLSTRTNANKFWMLSSGNAEVAFSSRTTTIEAVANLPISTLPSALTTSVNGILSTATAAAATRDASIPSSTSASDAFASTPIAAAGTTDAAATDATLSAGQKRKASP